ncbi:hypothetical protein HPB52_021743 [Rhipicephalus sanguineus]|uniref:Uncharacterized protein n=1 Tax=Rhipicephalus sanguineus TaxID=34632 RepID=A0A9D4T864_RHISA|nr:hypothetical protein HPB52_021743 [Rhipicephalus sanguineus]
MPDNTVCLCQALLCKKRFAVALGPSGFDASAGSLYRFGQRTGIMWQVACGEEKAADAESAIAWRNERFQEIVKSFIDRPNRSRASRIPEARASRDLSRVALSTYHTVRRIATVGHASSRSFAVSVERQRWRLMTPDTSPTLHLPPSVTEPCRRAHSSPMCDCEPTPRDCNDEAELDPELWNELTEKLPVDAAVSFEDYVDSDCAAATSAELTCEEIVSQMLEQDCCSSDEDDAGDAENCSLVLLAFLQTPQLNELVPPDEFSRLVGKTKVSLSEYRQRMRDTARPLAAVPAMALPDIKRGSLSQPHDIPPDSRAVDDDESWPQRERLSQRLRREFGLLDDDSDTERGTTPSGPEDALLPLGAPHMYGGYLPPPLQKLRICPSGVHCKLGAEFKDTPNTVWNRKAFGNVNTVAGFLVRLSGKIPQLSQLDTPKVLRDLVRKVPELPNLCVGNVRLTEP